MSIADRILARIMRFPGARYIWEKWPVGSVPLRVRHDIWTRPAYAYGVYAAADLAKRLKLTGISVIEFGVAGGRGLLELEQIAKQVSKYCGIKIAVFGFDTGKGMPEPADYRDLPHIWGRSFYKMDKECLKSRLTIATLILGDVQESVPAFIRLKEIDPLGFVSFDLDYYSSTKAAFELFKSADYARRLPRVYCYFDEIVWPEIACHNDYVGELCAIREFNLEEADKKLCPINNLRNMRVHQAGWNDQMYVLHDFVHPLYCANLDSVKDTHMTLGTSARSKLSL